MPQYWTYFLALPHSCDCATSYKCLIWQLKFIILYLLSNVDENTVKFQFPDWNPRFVVHNLGMLLDGDLMMAYYVNFLWRSCFYQLHQICVIWRNPSVSTAVILVHAFILKSVNWQQQEQDYLNAVHGGPPSILFAPAAVCHNIFRSRNHSQRVKIFTYIAIYARDTTLAVCCQANFF